MAASDRTRELTLRPPPSAPPCLVVFDDRPTGYYNPILAYGEELAVQHAREAGANGFIVVDLPPEEAVRFREVCASER